METIPIPGAEIYCEENFLSPEEATTLLGHASIQTTEKYLGMRQNLGEAVSDKPGIVDAEGE